MLGISTPIGLIRGFANNSAISLTSLNDGSWAHYQHKFDEIADIIQIAHYEDWFHTGKEAKGR